MSCKQVTCPDCHGTGRAQSNQAGNHTDYKCTNCNGRGTITVCGIDDYEDNKDEDSSRT